MCVKLINKKEHQRVMDQRQLVLMLVLIRQEMKTCSLFHQTVTMTTVMSQDQLTVQTSNRDEGCHHHHPGANQRTRAAAQSSITQRCTQALLLLLLGNTSGVSHGNSQQR